MKRKWAQSNFVDGTPESDREIVPFLGNKLPS